MIVHVRKKCNMLQPTKSKRTPAELKRKALFLWRNPSHCFRKESAEKYFYYCSSTVVKSILFSLRVEDVSRRNRLLRRLSKKPSVLTLVRSSQTEVWLRNGRLVLAACVGRVIG